MPQHFTQNEYKMIMLALGHLESYTDCKDELENIPDRPDKYGKLLKKDPSADYTDDELKAIQNKYLENIETLRSKLFQRIK